MAKRNMIKDGNAEYVEPSITKYVGGEVKQVGKRTLQFIGSDETVDRDGDILSIAGWDFTDFKKNPVALLDHNYWSAIDNIIGKATPKIDKAQKRLVFDIEFATADLNPRAERAFKMAQAGFLRTTSVGFIPTKSRHLDEEERKEEAKKRGSKKLPRRIFEKQELLEISLVTVPSNPNAVALAYEKGVLDQKDALAYFDDCKKFWGDSPDVNEEIDKAAELLKKTIEIKCGCHPDDKTCSFDIVKGKIVDKTKAQREEEIVDTLAVAIEKALEDKDEGGFFVQDDQIPDGVKKLLQTGLPVDEGDEHTHPLPIEIVELRAVVDAQTKAIDEINRKMDLVINQKGDILPTKADAKTTKEVSGDLGQEPEGTPKETYLDLLFKAGEEMKTKREETESQK